MHLPSIAAVVSLIAVLVLPASGEEHDLYVEHELLKVVDPAVTLSRTLPLAEGDGKITVEVVARISPKTDLKKQPGGWWYYLEFQDEEGHYLTGAYKGPKLTPEAKTFRELSSYIPAGTGRLRIGVGAKGKTYQQVTVLRVVHHRPVIVARQPADGARVPDNTPLFAWESAAPRVTVEISRDAAFAEGDTIRVPVQLRSELELTQVLKPGMWHWRVTNLDGEASAVRRFEQTVPAEADTAGPTLRAEHQYLPDPSSPLVIDVAGQAKVRSIRFEANGSASEPQQQPLGRASWSPPGGWRPGVTRVTVRAEDEHGNASERLVYVSHAQPPPAKVTWTRRHGVRLEGEKEPFLPMAMYMVRDHQMARVEAAGFNLVQHYGADGGDNTVTQAWLQAAHANELKAFVAFDRKKLAVLDLDFVAERVGALFAEPALLAWYLFDEPELVSHGVHPYKLEAVADLIRKLDPFHPVLLTLYHERYLPEYRNCFDVYLTQAYHRKPDSVRKEAIYTCKLLAEAKGPGSLIVHNYIPFASSDSNRCAAFIAVMYQNGVFWWGWWDDYFMRQFKKRGRRFEKRFQTIEGDADRRAAFEKELSAITADLTGLAPVFMAPGDPRVWEEGDVSFYLKATAGTVWLIAANTSASPTEVSTEPLPELKGIRALKRQGVATEITVDNGRVTLELDAFGVAVLSGSRQ